MFNLRLLVRVRQASCLFLMLTFAFAAQAKLKSNFFTADKVLISTDLETDDLFAIASLFHGWESANHRPNAIAFLVGEGDAYLKTVLMDHILRELKSIYPWTKGVHFTVIRGDSSKISYPTCILEKKWPNLAPALVEKSLGPDRETLESYFRSGVPQLIVSIKPERELLLDNCCQVDFSHTQLWRYGSFNDRTLWEEHKTDFQERWTNNARRFAAVVNLETFHALGIDDNGQTRGSVERVSSPEIYHAYRESSKKTLHNLLDAIMENWNEGIYLQMQSEVSALESEKKSPERDAKLYRTRKVLSAVKGNLDFQFIGADTLVSTLLQDPNLGEYLEEKHVSFNPQTGYTSYGDGQDKIYVTRTDGAHQKNLWLLMQKSLQSLFH